MFEKLKELRHYIALDTWVDYLVLFIALFMMLTIPSGIIIRRRFKESIKTDDFRVLDKKIMIMSIILSVVLTPIVLFADNPGGFIDVLLFIGIPFCLALFYLQFTSIGWCLYKLKMIIIKKKDITSGPS